MKKLLFTLLLILGLLSTMDVKAQYGVVVYGQEKDTLCFITDNLVNISHGEPNNDDVTLLCPDTVFVRNILSIDSISFVSIPDRMVLTEDIGDWSEMRLCKDGTIVMTKLENDDKPIEMFMMCPNDSLGMVLADIRFDDEANPVEMTMNEHKLLFDWLDGETFNLTIVFSDSMSCKFDSLKYTVGENEYAKVRRLVPDIDKKPWLTRLGGLVEFIGGLGSSVVGGVMVVGSGVTEIVSGGSSTPISLPGLGFGLWAVHDGAESMGNGFINAFTNDYATGWDNVGWSLFDQTVQQGLEKGMVPMIPDEYFSYLVDSKYNPSKGGWASFFASLTGQLLSNLQRPYTWFDLVRDVHQGVMTGLVKDITSNKATMRGYIWPYILESPSMKFQTEYGIIVYSTTNSKERYKKYETNGEGGMIEYTFSGLKPNTTYNYCTYYIDKTNSVQAVAEVKSFTTKAIIPTIDNFKQTKSQYKKGGFTHEGVNYDYRYDVAVTVSIEDLEGVADWGYVYRDPNGRDKEISLRSHGTSYTDNSYAYFRNTSPATVTLFGYVKYVGSDEPIYGEPEDFEVSHAFTSCPDANHPHWIDLGLPSGTQWRCCNEGASTPEEYGGYYTFGQVASAPTLDQIEEFLNNTTSVWTTQNGVNGRKFTSKINGGTLFLPAAGNRWDGGLSGVGDNGYYWSSTPAGEYDAYYLVFNSYIAGWGGYGRSYERSVRPVR